tara:strand:+ start:665 stop:1003 length:339 start_codon:yes stop_codon:yes gene_type:complete
MTKQAAEQIAQQYYQLGSQLALEGAGLTKEASRMKQLAKLLGVGGAAGAGTLATMNHAPEIAKLLKLTPEAANLAGTIPGKLQGAAQSIMHSTDGMGAELMDRLGLLLPSFK